MSRIKARRVAAVSAGKGVRTLSRRLHRGGGTTLPGVLAQKLDPSLIPDLIAAIPQGTVVVSGTNGKTTTSHMIAGSLRAAGFSPIHNHEGSNLHQGLATTLLAHTGPLGELKADDQSIGLLEIDEGVLPQLLHQVRPKVLLLTNVFRDQMDRYIELDYLVDLWRRELKHLPPDTTLVLNADDPLIATLGSEVPNPVIYFGLEDKRHGGPALQHASDTRRCPRCQVDLDFSLSFYSHLGHYRCPGCGWSRPDPQVVLRTVDLEGADSSRVEIAMPTGVLDVTLPLPGLYNAYNALAASAVGHALSLPAAALQLALEDVRSAFGRVERLEMEGHPVYLILVKNPSGFNQVLHLLAEDRRPKNLLLALNDNGPDGRDVSWIWDIDFEMSRGQMRFVLVAGLRAYDMAMRLKYAEWFEGTDEMPPTELLVEPDVIQALRRALERTPAGEPLYVVPTYTALWELRESLRRSGMVKPFWEVGAQPAREELPV